MASLQITDETYIISLSSPTGDEVHYFELRKHEDYTKILFESGQLVKNKDKLASTHFPITFYIKKNGELESLCLSTQSGSERTDIIQNNFTNNEEACP